MEAVVRYIVFLMFGVLAVGCTQQKYGECPEPDTDLKVVFKAKSGLNPFSHSFCVVCNTALAPNEYGAWAEEMGATAAGETPETPCLFAYADADEFPDGFETVEQCQAAICEGGAQYNDAVTRQNGNLVLDPIIGPPENE